MKSNYYVLPCRVLPEDIHKLIAIVVINPLTITVVKATTVSVLTYTRIVRQGHCFQLCDDCFVLYSYDLWLG